MSRPKDYELTQKQILRAERKSRNKVIVKRFLAGATREELMTEFNLKRRELYFVLNYQLTKGVKFKDEPVKVVEKKPDTLLFLERDEKLFAIYSTLIPANSTFHISGMGRR